MLAASGFVWSILTQGSALFTPTPRLFSVIGFIVLYLVISLLPLCCKVTKEEADLPLHEQTKENNGQNGQTDLSPPDDSGSSSLFKMPPGILRSHWDTGSVKF